jgi:hypothetical protein
MGCHKYDYSAFSSFATPFTPRAGQERRSPEKKLATSPTYPALKDAAFNAASFLFPADYDMLLGWITKIFFRE